jgi:hypothetical protein
MGGFVTPDVSSGGGYASGGGLLGFLQQGLQGYQTAHAGKVAEKQQGVENKQKADEATEKKKMDESTIQHQGLENAVLQAGLADAAHKQKLDQARTTRDNIIKQLQNNPEIAKDPSMMQGLTDTSNILGIPLVKNKDGTLNIDSTFPKQMSDLSLEEKAYYAGLSIPERKTQMKGIGGKDPEFMSAPPQHSYDQETKRKTAEASGTRADTGKKKEEHQEHRDNEKDPIWKREHNARARLLETVGADAQAKDYAIIRKLQAEAGEISVRAAAIPARLGLEQASLGLRSQALGISLQRLQFDQSKTALSSLHSTTQALDEYATRTRGEMNSAQKEYDAYIQTAKGQNSEDPLRATMLDRIHKTNDILFTVEQQSAQARSALKNHQFQALGITQNSGKQSTILPRKNQGGGEPIGKAPAGTADGTTREYNGKTITARGGMWY